MPVHKSGICCVVQNSTTTQEDNMNKFQDQLEYATWRMQDAATTVATIAEGGNRNALACALDSLRDAQKELASAARTVCRNA